MCRLEAAFFGSAACFLVLPHGMLPTNFTHVLLPVYVVYIGQITSAHNSKAKTHNTVPYTLVHIVGRQLPANHPELPVCAYGTYHVQPKITDLRCRQPPGRSAACPSCCRRLQ